MLIIVCGLPGSGKSTLSALLAEKLPAVHLNSDPIRKRMFEKPDYTEEEKRKVYAEMRRQAEELLKEGKNVILDATFYRKEYRGMMAGIAEEAGAKVFLIKCTLSEEEIRRRLEERKKGESVSDADYEVYRGLKGQFEPIEGACLEVDCSVDNGKTLALVRRFLGEKDG
jgi:predicted kinase